MFVPSLSPDEDPLCVLLMMDFYALHSGEYDFLIRLYDEWEVWRCLWIFKIIFCARVRVLVAQILEQTRDDP
jgi:hypothetical protein